MLLAAADSCRSHQIAEATHCDSKLSQFSILAAAGTLSVPAAAGAAPPSPSFQPASANACFGQGEAEL